MAKKYNYEKNGTLYFRKTKTIGHDINNKAIKKEFYGDGEKDANKQIEEYMNNLKHGLPIGYEKVTLAQSMNIWLFDVLFYADDFKSASFEKHETNFRLYIKNSPIGLIPIYNIVSLPIQQWYNELFENGLTSNKIRDINKTLSTFFTYQITQNMLRYNPCLNKRIRIPGNSELDVEKYDKDNKHLFLDEKELNTLKNNLDFNRKLDVAIWLSLTHMLREGEILGLSIKHIDIKKDKNIKIRQILTSAKLYNKDKSYERVLRLSTPKSKTSIRTIPLIKEFIPILDLHIKNQKKLYETLNSEWNENALLFLNNNLNFWDHKNFRVSWGRFLKRIGLPHYKFHILRHTGASLLFKSGATLEEVQELMGHEDSEVTRKIYLHFHPDDKKESINKISYLMNNLNI